jgi:DNA-binding CsgD family transcriptional regulator
MASLTDIRHNALVRTGTNASPRRGSAYEDFITRVYLAAVHLGVPTRARLREDGLADAEIDEGIAELLARHFLVPTADPDTWDVVPPREAMARHAEEMEHRLALTRATAGEIESAWRRAVGRDAVRALPDLDLLGGLLDITSRVVAMHRDARTRLWWALDGSLAGRQLCEQALEDEGLLAVRDGVDLRLMLDTSLLDDPETMHLADRHRAAGRPVRVGNGIPFGAIVCDEEVTLVDLSSYDPDGYGSIEVRWAAPVAAVTALLEQVWQLCTPYGPTVASLGLGPGLGAAPLDERDQRILSLLTTGASDQVIARQTGVSVRTVERRVRYLMDHLGAATRFQAGVQAMRRGWV